MQTKNNHTFKAEIRESISSSLGMIAILLSAIVFVLVGQDRYIGQIATSIFWLVLLGLSSFLLYKIVKLVRRQVVMLVDNHGVYHKDFRLMKWDDILSIKKTRESSGDSETVFFLFQTIYSNEPYKLTISGLDISEESFIKLIHSFKDYNIYEVSSDEW